MDMGAVSQIRDFKVVQHVVQSPCFDRCPIKVNEPCIAPTYEVMPKLWFAPRDWTTSYYMLMTLWCDCGHCVVLSNFTESECLCCCEMGDPVTAAQPEGCITEHPEFHIVCLIIAVLRIAYFELRACNDCMDEDIHKHLGKRSL
ncbi:hypothetical protein HPB49_004310 [Dermacentor silvarum]|uniref:Uncharacterized protein n=1 Tax=Dermacentor silvarum TaxID=543639 RepID=A0ACB8DU64_DERSI|nr:hypothetical protein HPB49_004310 [Dermacentor silvarum]